MKQILKGYASLYREFLGQPNDGSFLVPPANPLVLLAVCGLIGFVRNALSVALGAPHGFYSMDPDIQWTMITFPVHLCLFAPALLHGLLRLLGYRGVDADSIFGLAFHLQVLHLIIPFVDWLGFELGAPPYFVIGGKSIATEWFTNRLYMTPGIILAWWITAYMVARLLTSRLGVRWPAIIIASLVSFAFVLAPTYFLFPALNTLFSRTFGPYLWSPLKYILVYPKWFPFWGNGTYFAVTAVLGLIYYTRVSGLDGIRSFFSIKSSAKAYVWLVGFAVARSILDYVWVPAFSEVLYKILVLFNYTVYQFTLYLLTPAIAGFILRRVFSRPVNAGAVLRESVLVWVVYPLVPIINLILRSPPTQTIGWFRHIPAFMVHNNYLPFGLIAVVPVLLFFFARLMVQNSGADWLRALISVSVSLAVVYLLYYQWTLGLFFYFHDLFGPIFAAGFYTLSFLVALGPLANRFQEALGGNRAILPRLVLLSSIVCVGMMAGGLL